MTSAQPLAAPNTAPVAPKTPSIKLKKAVQRLVRGPDGTIGLIYIDLATLQQITDLTGYRIINSDNTIVEQTEDPTDPESPVIDAKPAEPGEEIHPGSLSSDHQKSVSMYDQARGFPVAPSPYRAPNTEGSTTTAAPSNPSPVTKPGSTPVSPVRDSRQVSPIRDAQNVPALADSAPTAQVRDVNDVGQVKTQQGSVLPALDQNRFAPFSSEEKTTSSALPSRELTPGAGLANLAPVNERPSTVYSMGPNRPLPPKQEIQDNINTSVKNVFGQQAQSVVTSGAQTPEQKAQIERGRVADAKARRGYSLTDQEQADRAFAKKEVNQNNRHPTGFAADFTVNPNDISKQVNQVSMEDTAMDFAARNSYKAGIGYSAEPKTRKTGYMGPDVAHFDTLGGTWGRGMTDNMRENLNFARETGIGPTPTFGAPTPTERPDPKSLNQGFVSDDERTIDRSGAPKSIFDHIGPTEDNTPSVSTDMKDRKIADATGAEAANMGAISRTPAEISRIARAVAGELDSRTMDGLISGDETATKEFANVVSTVENRAASKKFGSLGSTLVGDQYNSLMDSKKKTTDGLYTKYGPTLEKKISEYYAGSISPTNYAITNYHNPSLTNPSWSKKMTEQEQTGFHNFGVLTGIEPSYGPNQSFKDSRAKMGYSGASTWGDRQGTPSENRTRSSDSREAAGRGLASNHSSEHERDTSVSRSDSSRQNKASTGRESSSSGGNKSNKTDTSRNGSKESSKSSAGREANSSRGGVGAGKSNNGGRRAA